MERQLPTLLRIGEWRVDTQSGEISRGGVTVRLEERALRLLLCLAGRADEVVSIDELLDRVWTGVAVTQDSVYQAVASIRRQLGDDPKQPAYIATVPRQGYRMVAAVRPWETPEAGAPGRARPQLRVARMAAATLSAVLAAGLLFQYAAAPGAIPRKSVAVLPFLDLTAQMNQAPFADGMTEELIGRLSKVPGLRVPPPTASFYFKGKQMRVAEIARALGVAFLLDGSVRQAGGRMRISARLIRADNGYVVWSESYDRPEGDILWIQDDIAEEATKALRASIEGQRQGS